MKTNFCQNKYLYLCTIVSALAVNAQAQRATGGASAGSRSAAGTSVNVTPGTVQTPQNGFQQNAPNNQVQTPQNGFQQNNTQGQNVQTPSDNFQTTTPSGAQVPSTPVAPGVPNLPPNSGGTQNNLGPNENAIPPNGNYYSNNATSTFTNNTTGTSPNTLPPRHTFNNTVGGTNTGTQDIKGNTVGATNGFTPNNNYNYYTNHYRGAQPLNR